MPVTIIQLQGYYDRTNRHEPNFGDIRDTYDLDFIQHLRFHRHNFTWGLGARFSHGTNLQVVSGLTFNPSDRTRPAAYGLHSRLSTRSSTVVFH